MLGVTAALSSLSMDEAPINAENGLKKAPTHFTSLPNISTDKPTNSSYVLVRNNYSVCVYEVETDQPIDYSKKYSETSAKSTKQPSAYNKVVKSYNTTFSMYAETDLDQPTNYSLRYAEDDSDSDECTKPSKSESSEFVQDTIKTYCTEDTPYETPFNFSTSTSMSDLRIDVKDDCKSKPKQTTPPPPPIANNNLADSRLKSEFSSGLMSPEKPVNYCDEGTPGVFSRVGSFGSLNSIPADSKVEVKKLNEEKDKETVRVQKSSETKAVKFEEVVNYAEETPLMFSRTSSLASLDSIEQHSINDDRSSVVSDFSRLTSGLISPSELPDSPTQTVPPSPNPRKNPIIYPGNKMKIASSAQIISDLPPKNDVFEDVITKFKTESTPIQFSTATSLSNLSIDDYDEADGRVQSDDNDLLKKIDEDEAEVINDVLSEDEGDEDILAACINIGMQKNRYSQPKPESPSETDVALSSYSYQDTSEILTKFTSNKSTNSQTSDNLIVENSEQLTNNNNNNNNNHLPNGDTIKTYCTEDTPALLSQAGSHSDLSVLSIADTAKITTTKSFLSDIENNLSDEDDTLLTECIQSAMPKANQSTVNQQTQPMTSLNISFVTVSDDETKSSITTNDDDDDDDDDHDLLKECILAGMPKSANKTVSLSIDENDELTEAERALLEQCILEGMPKRKTKIKHGDGLTEVEQDLLRECILSGMPKKEPSTSMTDLDRALLQQCIISGMPKGGKTTTTTAPTQVVGEKIDKNLQGSTSGCCIHCPRNKQRSKTNNAVKLKKKSKVQFRERTDINIFYVASHTLALKKELLDNVEWV